MATPFRECYSDLNNFKDFPPTGKTFEAFHQACDWLKENGYSHGSMQRDAPIGIMRGLDWDIAKWRNLSEKERRELDGTMIPIDGNFRDGGARIRLRGEP